VSHVELLGIISTGVLFALLGPALVVAIVIFWPLSTGESGLISGLTLGRETRLLLITPLAGALGGYIHSVTSYVAFLGNRQLKRSWMPWYLLRPMVGMALAMALYLALRGGLFASGSDSTAVNGYGVAAISALAGLFSKQAVDKLREIAETVFKAEQKSEAALGDRLGESSQGQSGQQTDAGTR
jgi:hypothetical protein